MKLSGIYTITNKVNGKLYIGSSNDMKGRLSSHKSCLKRNLHRNTHLQRAWNKYGESNFEFEILEECKEQYLNSQENYWCYWLNTHNRRFGYNIASILENTFKIPKESYEKAVITRKLTAEKLGYWLTKETRDKISATNKGKPSAFKDKKHSDENKKKLSEYRIGKPLSEDIKKKISKGHTGKKFSIDHKNKLAESSRKIFSTPRSCEYCDIIVSEGNYRRWHGEKCKKKINI
jgi:group I intron endonuclease